MASRYGRNQKRRHLTEIERLRHELDLTITGGFQRATGREQPLEPLIGVPISIDINDSEDGFTIQRNARIRFIPPTRKDAKAFTYHAAYSGLFSWRGIVWIAPMGHRVDPGHAFFDQEIMEIELRALGDRDDRRPATSPFRPTYDIKRHRRIAA